MLVAAVAIGGCGGTSTGSRTNGSTQRQDSGRRETAAERADFVKRAEAVCVRAAREEQSLKRDLPTVISQSSSPEQGIMSGLVKPGIQILSQQSTRLRILQPRPSSAVLNAYIGLFEPILALARQRLEAGETMDPERGHELELLIAGLASEQSKFAKQFGFTACGVGFIEALGGTE